MLLIVIKYWHRFSNTLLVSLNNRIYIRKISSDRAALFTPRALESSTAKVHVELEAAARESSHEMSPMTKDRNG
jgi:hypothetical protein